MTDVLIVVIILTLVCLAAAYVIKAKKSGQKCIGCPHSKSCSGCCSCSSQKDA